MHPEVHLTYQPLKWGGRCEWDNIFPPTNIRIKVDANSGDHIQFVIHELLHVVFFDILVGRVDETLEEVYIMALDNYMITYVNKSPERLAKWDRAIKKKLNEGQIPIPQEELAKRD